MDCVRFALDFSDGIYGSRCSCKHGIVDDLIEKREIASPLYEGFAMTKIFYVPQSRR
jgi:hypothetical protein